MAQHDLSSVPFAAFSCTVPESVIDYNGHMNDAAYAQVLTDANEMFLDALGLSAAYREATGCSMYTVEITIKFLHEVGRNDVVRAKSTLASHDAKRVRVRTTLLVGDDTAVASGDSLYLHVDTTAGRVSNFPNDRAQVLARVQQAHDEASPAR